MHADGVCKMYSRKGFMVERTSTMIQKMKKHKGERGRTKVCGEWRGQALVGTESGARSRSETVS
jgi:hypothetical protein